MGRAERPGAAGWSASERVGAVCAAARALRAAGELDRAVGLLRGALADRPPAGPADRCRLLDQLHECLYALGRSGEAFAVLDEATELAADLPASALTARLAAAQGSRLMLRGRYAEAIERCEEAVGLAESTGAAAVRAYALNTLGVCMAMRGDSTGGRAALRASRQAAEAAGSTADLARAAINLTFVLANGTRYAECVVEARAALATLDDYGLAASLGSTVYANLAAALIALGRWSDVDTLCGQAERLPLPPKTHRLLLVYQAEVAALRGEPDSPAGGATDRPGSGAAALLARAGQVGDENAVIEVERTYASALADRSAGRLRSAVDTCRSAIRLPAVTASPADVLRVCALGLGALADLATAGRQVRRPDDAAVAAAELAAMATSAKRSWLAGGPPPEAAALHRQCELELAWSAERDPQPWTELTQRWQDVQMPYHAAYAGLRCGDAFVGRRDRPAAEVALRAAHRTAADLGAHPLRRQIERVARRGRVALGSAGDEHRPTGVVNTLTRREHEVLELLALGRTNREIAGTLVISERTTSVHVSHILAKLGAGNRAEAGRIARDLLG